MTDALLIVALGPVQEFIAQARRTRDLWFGSHLLSELSKAAAAALAHQGELVFPALKHGDLRLRPQDEPSGAFNVANKIVALVPVERAEQAARAARSAAGERLRELANRVRTDCASLLAKSPAIDAVWDEQVADFLDFQAVWLPCDPQADDYPAARQKAEAVLAARKALRDFKPWHALRGDVPKSSLDGGRETVLLPPSERDVSTGAWRQYRIGASEQLDALGLLKRAGGRPQQFIPIANVAAAAWLRARSPDERRDLERLALACRDRPLPCIKRAFEWVRLFPYDIELLRAEREPALQKAHGLSPGWFAEHVSDALRRAPAPPSYVACLVADGDRMGQTLESLRQPRLQRVLSQALAGFATRVRDVVEDEHDGLLIYAGGDDVLAFVALERAVSCAEALRAAFADGLASALPAGVPRPTLSVGLGVGHVLESLGDLLAEGRQAEQHAKGCRNALAVRVSRRAGAALTWRCSWEHDPSRALSEAYTRLAQQQLALGKVHAVRALLRRLEHDWSATPANRRLLAEHTWGVLRRSDAGGHALTSAGDAGLPFEPHALAPECDVWAAVEEWSARHLVARELAGGVESKP